MLKLYRVNTSFDSYIVKAANEERAKLNAGDYIATGVDGEHWAIDKNIFERTYKRVD